MLYDSIVQAQVPRPGTNKLAAGSSTGLGDKRLSPISTR